MFRLAVALLSWCWYYSGSLKPYYISQLFRSHHIHLVNHHSAWYQHHILFRDYLRQNTKEAKHYEKFKLDLALTINENDTDIFHQNFIAPFLELAQEYQKLWEMLGGKFTISNQYALPKSRIITDINQKLTLILGYINQSQSGWEPYRDYKQHNNL